MKKIIIPILIIMLVLAMTTPVFADTINFDKLKDINNPTGTGALAQASGKVIGIMYVIAMIVSIGMLLVIGIKYITSSPDQKADLKARAVPYLIGAALIFGAGNILKFIESISKWIE